MSQKNAEVNDVLGKVVLFIEVLASTFDKSAAKRKRF
jgi:hypothetical protein